jgi:hypothetical protein
LKQALKILWIIITFVGMIAVAVVTIVALETTQSSLLLLSFPGVWISMLAIGAHGNNSHDLVLSCTIAAFVNASLIALLSTALYAVLLWGLKRN